MNNEKHISKVGKDGFVLTLDDGSKWSIRIGDNVHVAIWCATQRVVVKQNISGRYTLQNLDAASKGEIRTTRRR